MEFLKVVVAAVLRVNENKHALIKALALPFFASLLIDLVTLLDPP